MFSLLLSIVISASIDSAAIKLGDQCHLTLEATADLPADIRLPRYPDNVLIPGIECVNRGPIDTTMDESAHRITLSQRITLTSFEDSLYAIPPQPFVINGDTLWAQPMALNVIQPFVLDTTDAITDIKPLMPPPYWWWEVWRWIFLALGIILLAALGYLGYWYYQRRKKRKTEAVVDNRPAEVIALERLDLIRSTKVWRVGREKDYHTELTDTVRDYIGRRFAIRSTAKTSDETLRALEGEMRDQQPLYDRLSSMLRLADLVKFAKWQATPEENEQSLSTAYDFVHDTTPVEAPDAPPANP